MTEHQGSRRIAKIDRSHRMTIPAGVFHTAGLQSGDRVVVRAQGLGRVVIECESLLDDCSGTIQSVYGDHFIESTATSWRP